MGGDRNATVTLPKCKINWKIAKDWYVTSEQQRSYREVAEKFGVQKSTVVHHAKREGWPEQREQYRHLVSIKTREKASTLEAEARVRQMKVAETMYRAANLRVTGDEDAKVVALDPNDLTWNEVRQYFKDAAEIERRALGLDSDRVPDDVHITFKLGGRLPGGGCVETDNDNVNVEGEDDE